MITNKRKPTDMLLKPKKKNETNKTIGFDIDCLF